MLDFSEKQVLLQTTDLFHPKFSNRELKAAQQPLKLGIYFQFKVRVF